MAQLHLSALSSALVKIAYGMVKQNGQCWKSAKTMDGGTFGSWGACSSGASTPAPAAAHRKQHS